MALLLVGDRAPAFRATDQNGDPVALADFKGKKVVLYFYPKDDTPGCTKEACGFRDLWPRLRRKNVAVLGVSTDDARSHARFADKYSLPFTLVADPDRKIVRDYGVWGEKKLYGRTFMGTRRVTYLIDEKGKVAAVWPKVKPEGHAEEILEKIDGL